MFAKDLSVADLERLGPIIEQLLQSGRLTDDEKWAVDLSCRAAMDLVQIRHSEVAKDFYGRPDIQERSENSIAEWLMHNADAAPGTVTAICGQMHVASCGEDGKLNLFPLLDP